MTNYRTIEWRDGAVRMLDQRLLPHAVHYIDYTDVQGVAEAIRNMVIRGAPAIGAAAAYGLALAASQSQAQATGELLAGLEQAGAVLQAARPTAVNLSWAVNRMLRRLSAAEAGAAEAGAAGADRLRRLALQEAQAIAEEDVQTNRQIGLNALPLVPPKATFLHHCNTGSLATVDYGTALGVIRTAHEHRRQVFVYVDETRPRLQGARLTAWELQQLGIPFAVIVDGASGHIMRKHGVDLVTVGCDRVAGNGDTANKIGTYNLALAARAHGVPFYVVGPTATIDLAIPSGDDIQIEERSPDEVTHVGQEQVTPPGAQVCNPAFDVTPAEYITAIITEAGIAYPPYTASLPRMVKGDF
jgi:methylthioribose-1-phosphate isomerase